MREFKIVDMTLRQNSGQRGANLSFREKLELAKLLEKLGVDVIDVGYVGMEQADSVTARTLAATIAGSQVCCCVGLGAEEIERTWAALEQARLPRVNIVAPASTVQMEYSYQMKASQLLARAAEQVAACSARCPTVELTAEDATRSEPDFLRQLISAAIRAGATTITLADSAGRLLPEEAAAFIRDLYATVPELSRVNLGLQFRDDLGLAIANALMALNMGACELRTTINGEQSSLSMERLAHSLRQRSDAVDAQCRLRQTELQRTCKQMEHIMGLKRNGVSAFNHIVNVGETRQNSSPNEEYTADLDMTAFCQKLLALGYTLPDDDVERVYAQFLRLAGKKTVYERDIEALIAENTRQVAPTYQLTNYVSNSGNNITATACIKVDKNGEAIQSVAAGDGPIDAAFLAIDQMVGHHFELEDFQIQSVTEGRDSMGDALVKLRHNGSLYSGRGLSTDIIGASIRAYLNAINKIVYEEKNYQ